MGAGFAEAFFPAVDVPLALDDLPFLAVDAFVMEVVLVRGDVATRDLSFFAGELGANQPVPEGVMSLMFIS